MTDTYQLPRMLTIAEVADIVGCSRAHIARLARNNEIPHKRLGRIVRFHADTVTAWLTNQQETQP